MSEGDSDGESNSAAVGDPAASPSSEPGPSTQQSPITHGAIGETRARSWTSIVPDRILGVQTGGRLYTYIRNRALSTFSSQTSLSSKRWDSHQGDNRKVHNDSGWLRVLAETIFGLSLAVVWLTVGRLIGTIEQPSRQPRIQEVNDRVQSEGSSNTIEN